MSFNLLTNLNRVFFLTISLSLAGITHDSNTVPLVSSEGGAKHPSLLGRKENGINLGRIFVAGSLAEFMFGRNVDGIQPNVTDSSLDSMQIDEN